MAEGNHVDTVGGENPFIVSHPCQSPVDSDRDGEMIIQNGHNFFGSATNNDELKEPKSFLAHLRENIETSLYTSTSTPSSRILAPLTAHDDVVPKHTDTERISKVFGDKKVATFYLHMTIAISTFIVLIFLGVSAYVCYKR